MDGGDRLGGRAAGGQPMIDEQRQQMAFGSADLLADNDFDAVRTRDLAGQQRAGDCVMIGDGDQTQIGVRGDMFENRGDTRYAVAVGCMDMDIGFAIVHVHRRLLQDKDG
jgi:hypothetical protein